MTSLEEMLSAYIEAALWSSADMDGYGEYLDANYGREDLAPEIAKRMRADCAAFMEAHAADIEAGHFGVGAWSQAGHDFWLTRCGHGCGFWDGDWPEPQASRLTEACEALGNVDLYVGDDGLIYAC